VIDSDLMNALISASEQQLEEAVPVIEPLKGSMIDNTSITKRIEEKRNFIITLEQKSEARIDDALRRAPEPPKTGTTSTQSSQSSYGQGYNQWGQKVYGSSGYSYTSTAAAPKKSQYVKNKVKQMQESVREEIKNGESKTWNMLEAEYAHNKRKSNAKREAVPDKKVKKKASIKVKIINEAIMLLRMAVSSVMSNNPKGGNTQCSKTYYQK
jgi:hypothetical protein